MNKKAQTLIELITQARATIGPLSKAEPEYLGVSLSELREQPIVARIPDPLSQHPNPQTIGNYWDLEK